MNIKLKISLPDYRDLLRYGEVISDYENNWKNDHTRIRKIRYMGILYHLKIVNGELKTLMQWDCFPYNEEAEDLKTLSDHELSNLFMFADRDRKENLEAERVYWLCVKEINKRIDDEEA